MFPLNKKIGVTVGIPRGLSYYEHGFLWETFFRQLGFNVIISNKTNIEILNNGVICCTNDTCLPVKVFHGHIMELKNKADYIFVPRYSSICENEYCCPKLCGLPEMVTYNIKDNLSIIEIKINENSKQETYKSLRTFSKSLGLNFHKVLSAFENTVEKHLKNEFQTNTIPKSKKKIAVLGHPYMLYDEYLSMNLLNKLTNQGYLACTPINIRAELKKANAYPYNNCDKQIFYSVGLDNLGSAFSFINFKDVCGIIYLTPFACGIDSLVTEFIERGLKGRTNIPLMKLTIDEHTGEAGFDTRLEAFLDMIV